MIKLVFEYPDLSAGDKISFGFTPNGLVVESKDGNKFFLDKKEVAELTIMLNRLNGRINENVDG